MSSIKSPVWTLPLTAAIISTSATVAFAGSTYVADPVAPPIEPADEESFIDKLWDIPVLYSNKDNPYIQKVQIIGRYHGQWHNTDANTGEDSGWENRRFRLGAKVQFLEDFTLGGEFNLDNTTDFSGDRFIRNIDEVQLKWAPSDEFWLGVGKIKPKFTQEYTTSSKRIVTVERSLLVNQTIPGKPWGVHAGGEKGAFDWELGAYFGATDGDYDFPETDAGYGYTLSVGYDITDNTNITFDYINNDGDDENNEFSSFNHLFSLHSTSKFGKFGFITDFIAGAGDGDTEDVFGIVLLPTYDVTDKFQLVGRYQYATSSGDGGIRLQSRYERPAIEDGSSQFGDNYHAFYFGGQYFLNEDKLKLISGIEYSTLGGDADFNGFTFFSGVRLYF